MSITVSLNHVTNYKYGRPVNLGTQTIRLRPAPHVRNLIKSYSLKVEPKEHFINWQQDPFGNFLARIDFPEKVVNFRVEVDLLTEVRVFNPFDFFLEAYAEKFPFEYEANLKDELAPYLEIKETGAKLKQWLENCDTSSKGIIDFLVAVNQTLNQSVAYTLRMEPGVQSCADTLSLGSGSCRDMAWLLCQALRHLGLATRFASGYLIQLAADVKSLDGPSGTEVDFTDLHAWTEVYLPGAGWVGLDPTSGLFAGESHVPLCCTPNPLSAAPISGTLEDGISTEFAHDMSVQRILETPRVTKPYTNEQWSSIDILGNKIEEFLQENDVRLTMGGEPTFVSIDDRENNAWHYGALGGDKKSLAKDMLYRLKDRFANGAMHMFTQGKWYPGEILPRWAMPCTWRVDNIPIWTTPDLFADPDIDAKHTLKTAKAFITALSRKLGIPKTYILEAREDTPYYLWKDHRMPLADSMMVADVFEKTERERLQKLMDEDLNAPTGFVLPLHYSHRREQWISNPWTFKSGHLVLLAGDSPIGTRLPLSSLPSPEEAEDEIIPERAVSDMAKKLPSAATLKKRLAAYKTPNDKPYKKDPNGLIKTAICAQVRDGVLHIYLPPVAWSEHFLELIKAVELTAAETGISVVLEGYRAPSDPRLVSMSVTPDPGVIEVNVQPAESWAKLKDITNTVYEEGRLSRLSTEKFMLDGRRTGTGGGNHIVLGAAHPKDSPFLRRPDLLRSFISFWQNHPALSYVFAGTFIGPTSQAPRIDEARHDSMYELEIAFSQILKDEDILPQHVDRLFRNLLVDLTGNTHRAEFCIDKLYSPDSERGRLGLLEMRGFEMPPHPQMSLLQSLLIRACLAMFWKTPYEGGLIRWGTQLHDKFMLPYFLKQDMTMVLDALAQAGFKFDLEWFTPFFAFRFPECGRAQIANITLELRSALEPWPVMGEEPFGGGISRSVDATVERLELSVRGLVKGRHQITCNGRVVPLCTTNVEDLLVAGIRFKAWAQSSSLHPQMDVHAPLVFDVVDLLNETSAGGFTYHVAHPGGRSFETYPVNENEAEGRRMARFETEGHTPGKVTVAAETTNPYFPYTLDLRR